MQTESALCLSCNRLAPLFSGIGSTLRFAIRCEFCPKWQHLEHGNYAISVHKQPKIFSDLAKHELSGTVFHVKLEAIYKIAFRLMGDERRAHILLAAIPIMDLSRIKKNETLECFLRELSSVISDKFRRLARLNCVKRRLDGDAFQQALNEIPPEERLAFTLVTVAELSYLECSVSMGVSVQMIEKYLRRARLSLWNSRDQWQ